MPWYPGARRAMLRGGVVRDEHRRVPAPRPARPSAENGDLGHHFFGSQENRGGSGGLGRGRVGHAAEVGETSTRVDRSARPSVGPCPRAPRRAKRPQLGLSGRRDEALPRRRGSPALGPMRPGNHPPAGSAWSRIA